MSDIPRLGRYTTSEATRVILHTSGEWGFVRRDATDVEYICTFEPTAKGFKATVRQSAGTAETLYGGATFRAPTLAAVAERADDHVGRTRSNGCTTLYDYEKVVDAMGRQLLRNAVHARFELQLAEKEMMRETYVAIKALTQQGFSVRDVAALLELPILVVDDILVKGSLDELDSAGKADQSTVAADEPYEHICRSRWSAGFDEESF